MLACSLGDHMHADAIRPVVQRDSVGSGAGSGGAQVQDGDPQSDQVIKELTSTLCAMRLTAKGELVPNQTAMCTCMYTCSNEQEITRIKKCLSLTFFLPECSLLIYTKRQT